MVQNASDAQFFDDNTLPVESEIFLTSPAYIFADVERVLDF